jgi:hypothetical protein
MVGLGALSMALVAVCSRDRYGDTKFLKDMIDFWSDSDKGEEVKGVFLAPCVMSCVLAFFGVCLALFYAAAGPLLVVALIYLTAELALSCVRGCRSAATCMQAAASGGGSGGAATASGGCCAKDQTSLNLELKTCEGSSSSFAAMYRGPLPTKFWRAGRSALALGLVALLLPPACGLACLTAPLAPLLPLPLLFNPRGRPPTKIILVAAAFLAAAATAMLWGLFLRQHWTEGPGGGALGWYGDVSSALGGNNDDNDGDDYDDDSSKSEDDSGWASKFVTLLVVFVASCFGCTYWLARAPSSNCACCAPVWDGVWSLPLTLLLGSEEAKREYMAFAPTPDLPTQAPLAMCIELMNPGSCCDSD